MDRQCSKCRLRNHLVEEAIFLGAVAKALVALRFESDGTLSKLSQTLIDARAAFPDRLAGAAGLRVIESAVATLRGENVCKLT